ncbi:hemolysin family protein [Marinoscillum furvescens]|uniref:CBS domain containing-hemolysin-like protein n=1 Tax=Marinoscillum furvescens DSM 4134 TaxID=1122208 RepID=A0A3D9L4I8_MARFU|nr:hemolysin family protein [Marinoscillum furvescens]RED98857.1 CBS domain containing-hemolysin-like protein [Marinoscillum furvescens DSM 4134]
MEDPSLYIGIVTCLLFSAFFSGIEIAFISADKLHIEVMSKKGTFTGRVLSEFVTRRSHFLATTLVGNNLSIVLYGILMAKLLEPLLYMYLPEALQGDVVVLVLQSLLSTIVVLITAEFLPKSLFMLNPDTMLTVFSVPMATIYALLYPVVFLIVHISRFIISNVLRFDYSEDKPVFGLTDLNNYIKKNILNVEKEEDAEIDAKIFNNAIEFKTIRVRECMIPRTEIVAVDVEDDLQELKDEFIQSGHSKILVYKESIDDVIGYCHSLELFKKPESIKDMLTPILIVPETMLANELLIQFITDHKSIALVVDEYGGTSGIVTMEDVIEEIFGEIRDEHDDEYLVEEQIDEHNFILSARHEVDYLNDKYDWNLPQGEYDTLGGLILAFHEDIPTVNEVILISPFHFTIFTMEENRIDKVKLTILDSEEPL